MPEMTQEQLTHHFNRLDALLAVSTLPTSDGNRRENVSDDEFMLMNDPGHLKGDAAFKHRHTRHYVYVRYAGDFDVLVVEPAGVFDADPIVL